MALRRQASSVLSQHGKLSLSYGRAYSQATGNASTTARARASRATLVFAGAALTTSALLAWRLSPQGKQKNSVYCEDNKLRLTAVTSPKVG